VPMKDRAEKRQSAFSLDVIGLRELRDISA
jgi:hypothetical protein